MRWLIYGMVVLVLGVVTFAMWPKTYAGPGSDHCIAAYNALKQERWQKYGERVEEVTKDFLSERAQAAAALAERHHQLFKERHPECDQTVAK